MFLFLTFLLKVFLERERRENELLNETHCVDKVLRCFWCSEEEELAFCYSKM